MKTIKSWESTYAVCLVALKLRDIEVVYGFLNKYFANREALNLDYAIHPEDESYVFKSEREMVAVFADINSSDQLFFWNEKDEPKKYWMAGVNFISDGATIFSITIPANEDSELNLLSSLKNHFKVEEGIVVYNKYPSFESLSEFYNLSKN